MGSAERMRRMRERRLLAKQCTQCGEPAGGKWYCPECAEKRRPYNQEYSREYNPGYWAANKERINAGRRRG